MNMNFDCALLYCSYRISIPGGGAASSLVASVGNRDHWKNNGSAVLNGNAINATARTNNG